MDILQSEEIKQAVRERYRTIAVGELQTTCCEPTPTQTKKSSCCSTKEPDAQLLKYNTSLGYSKDELKGVPEESNMALGCGNPIAIAQLNEGETVLDLGSGGGFDCFLASQRVSTNGKVIGIDMTPEMITKARQNAVKGKFENVEFRLGEIENIPAGDSTVDVIISNCVINLSTDKQQVFKESYRILKPGGRLAISDVVLTATLPTEILNDLSMYCSCTSGAVTIEEYQATLTNAGFKNISIVPKEDSRVFIREWREGLKLDDYIMSAIIEARK